MKKLLYVGNKLSAHGNTPTAIEVLGPLLESEGFEVGYASSKKSKIVRLAEMFWRTIRTPKTSCVIIDTYSTSNFWYAFVVSQTCRIRKIPYIPILHGGGLPKRLSQNRGLSRMIFKNAYANVAPSGYLLKAFREAGFNNVIYIENPVELDDFTFKVRNSASTKLLWVRSLSPIYNPEMALDVARELKSDFSVVKLAMVGPDKSGMLQSLNGLARESDIDFTFFGKQTKPEWAAIAADFDIFINTSRVDNAPYSLIEAAALGLPIVSTNVGGIPFLLENNKNALLVDENDAVAMANAIKEVIRNKELRDQIIDNAYQLSMEFSWEKIRFKWLEILK